MSTWTLLQCYSVFDDFLLLCDEDHPGLRDEVERRAFLLMELGNKARAPISKALTDEDGLFELRASTNVQARILYCFQPGRRIVFLEAVIKKGGIPESSLKRARDLKREVDDGLGTNIVAFSRKPKTG